MNRKREGSAMLVLVLVLHLLVLDPRGHGLILLNLHRQMHHELAQQCMDVQQDGLLVCIAADSDVECADIHPWCLRPPVTGARFQYPVVELNLSQAALQSRLDTRGCGLKQDRPGGLEEWVHGSQDHHRGKHRQEGMAA